MFAQDSLMVGQDPLEVVLAVRSLAHTLTLRLEEDGRDQLARIGVRVGTIPIYRSIRLVIGDPALETRQDRLMLPVSWDCSDGPAVFPRMDGILMVGPAASGGTTITLNATYDPPLGRLGELMDRILMHRLADQLVHDFLGRLVHSLLAALDGDSATVSANDPAEHGRQ